MMSWKRFAIAALVFGSATGALAAADAEVESLQMPVWIERAGQRSPLEAGAALRNGDRIETGGGSRVLLRMADGSSVKLSENARFELRDLQRAKDETGVFKATLSVLEGAFRFTTAAIYKFRGRREIDVHFRTVTAGIRGTDLWGKSGDERDIVCLIEGHISVARGSEPPIDMQDPKTVYQSPHSGEAPPVSPVDPAQLTRWAAETEIAAGSGSSRKGGKWRVFLMRADSGDDLADLFSQVADAGYSARIAKLSDEGKPAYWLYVGNLPDRIEAKALATKLRELFRLPSVSVSIQ